MNTTGHSGAWVTSSTRCRSSATPTTDPRQVKQLDGKPDHQLDQVPQCDRRPGQQCSLVNTTGHADARSPTRPRALALPPATCSTTGSSSATASAATAGQASSLTRCSSVNASGVNNKADDQGTRKKGRFINLFLFSSCSRCSRSVPVLFPSPTATRRNPETQQIRGLQPDSVRLFPLFPVDFANSAG